MMNVLSFFLTLAIFGPMLLWLGEAIGYPIALVLVGVSGIAFFAIWLFVMGGRKEGDDNEEPAERGNGARSRPPFGPARVFSIALGLLIFVGSVALYSFPVALEIFGMGLLFLLPGIWLANFRRRAAQYCVGIAFVIVLVAAIINWYMDSHGLSTPLWINSTAMVLVLMVFGWHLFGPRLVSWHSK